MGLRTRFLFPAKTVILSFATALVPVLGPTYPPIQLVSRVLSPREERPWLGADNWSPTSAKAKNGWSYSPPLPHIFMAWCLLKAEGQLIFTLSKKISSNLYLCFEWGHAYFHLFINLFTLLTFIQFTRLQCGIVSVTHVHTVVSVYVGSSLFFHLKSKVILHTEDNVLASRSRHPRVRVRSPKVVLLPQIRCTCIVCRREGKYTKEAIRKYGYTEIQHWHALY
jgi:hypothetical protein